MKTKRHFLFRSLPLSILESPSLIKFQSRNLCYYLFDYLYVRGVARRFLLNLNYSQTEQWTVSCVRVSCLSHFITIFNEAYYPTSLYCNFVFFSGQATLVKEPTVQIQCLSGSMLITIKNAPSSYEGLFSGMVYPKGLAKNSTCLSEYR